MLISFERIADIQHCEERMFPRLNFDVGARSLIIQSMPKTGGAVVLDRLASWLYEKWALADRRVVIEKDLSTFWVKPLSGLVKAIRLDLKPAVSAAQPSNDSFGDLERELSGLKNDVRLHAAKGGETIVILNKFDSLLKCGETNQVQHFLNTLQSLGSSNSNRVAFVVRCFRDIEDICQASNYSDFYKVFGTNHCRISRWKDAEILSVVKAANPGLNGSALATIVELAAGYPEHAEVIVEFVGNRIELEQGATDALATVFEDWVNCMTPDEQQVLDRVAHSYAIGIEDRFALRKLVRKGVLAETDAGGKIVSPLFERHLKIRVGKIAGAQVPFIRMAGLLTTSHRLLMEKLFLGRSYLSWKFLQEPRPDDATVYEIKGEDGRGVAYRPCIVKIHRSDEIEREIVKSREAKEILGPVVPPIINKAVINGPKAIVIEYASSDNLMFEVNQFAGFYSIEPIDKIEDLLERLFLRILRPFFAEQSIRNERPDRHFHLPREERGEFDVLDLIASNSTFFDAVSRRLLVPHSADGLLTPASVLRRNQGDDDRPFKKLFLEKRRMGICRVHGDLNPRNLLVDGIGNVHIIDFTTMKSEGARFTDIARLEAEIKFKLSELECSGSGLLSAIEIERYLVEAKTESDWIGFRQLPFTAGFTKLVRAVVKLRQLALKICSGDTEPAQFDEEYKTALLAQTLRIALFENYLSADSLEFAVISAAMLTRDLLKG